MQSFLGITPNGWGCEKCWDWDSVQIPRDEVSKKPICFLIGGKPAFFTPLVSKRIYYNISISVASKESPSFDG